MGPALEDPFLKILDLEGRRGREDLLDGPRDRDRVGIGIGIGIGIG